MTSSLVKVLHRMQELFHNLVAALESALFGETSSRRQRSVYGHGRKRRRSLDELAQEVDRLFNAHLDIQNMLAMSARIKDQLRSCLQSNPSCMLPSYNHALPTGKETGTFLALDVGGSTFRVALIELSGREHGMKIVSSTSMVIDEDVKALQGTDFFDWMAERIDKFLTGVDAKYGREEAPLSIGLSWSFPVDQTSASSGNIQGMGKGFRCSDSVLGQELGGLIVSSCQKRSLNVRMDAIVNDSSATLLTRAYVDPKTRMSLILGTGTNAAVHFPVHEIGLAKFGARPPGWFDRAKHVIINTELSMFGGDFQPLEYMITGRYLGEIVRLIIVEAVETASLFGGDLPHSMKEPYSLDTAIVAFIEGDTSPSLAPSAALLQKNHTFSATPTVEDLKFIKHVCKCVSNRSAGYLSTAIYSMWCLRNEAEFPVGSMTEAVKKIEPQEVTVTELEQPTKTLSIACDGSVINKYPGFRDRCQSYLDILTRESADAGTQAEDNPSITLELAHESAIFGAAVAVAIAVTERESLILSR
ncbi:hexokinase, putative [Talaromyces stipitatus ATCC 10500]|uniref:Phosphotransferase n=1 Tax=Talaromyces stipitatus (strain ATCC 10500 / CBS 375.48 / QM 6759 / NRRL 1006) TaxID=441959 RepID=B8LZC2_TALSN|nr:hexokinase, putative [Talaromyces stipitatus ATCC 10500]EED21675.1 hexokinase, putative [Talaromyces stipitatus ATCC 10500]